MLSCELMVLFVDSLGRIDCCLDWTTPWLVLSSPPVQHSRTHSCAATSCPHCSLRPILLYKEILWFIPAKGGLVAVSDARLWTYVVFSRFLRTITLRVGRREATTSVGSVKLLRLNSGFIEYFRTSGTVKLRPIMAVPLNCELSHYENVRILNSICLCRCSIDVTGGRPSSKELVSANG